MRTGRISAANVAYAVTSCVEGRRMRLVPLPYQPREAMRPAEIVISCLQWLHAHRRITGHAYVVMPDHVHLIFSLGEGETLTRVMTSFGSFTARRLNALDGTCGRFWQQGYYDHAIRSQEDLRVRIEYLLANPVRKDYVLNPEDWPFSEAYPDWNDMCEERDYLL